MPTNPALHSSIRFISKQLIKGLEDCVSRVFLFYCIKYKIIPQDVELAMVYNLFSVSFNL